MILNIALPAIDDKIVYYLITLLCGAIIVPGLKFIVSPTDNGINKSRFLVYFSHYFKVSFYVVLLYLSFNVVLEIYTLIFKQNVKTIFNYISETNLYDTATHDQGFGLMIAFFLGLIFGNYGDFKYHKYIKRLYLYKKKIFITEKKVLCIRAANRVLNIQEETTISYYGILKYIKLFFYSIYRVFNGLGAFIVKAVLRPYIALPFVFYIILINFELSSVFGICISNGIMIFFSFWVIKRLIEKSTPRIQYILVKSSNSFNGDFDNFTNVHLHKNKRLYQHFIQGNICTTEIIVKKKDNSYQEYKVRKSKSALKHVQIDYLIDIKKYAVEIEKSYNEILTDHYLHGIYVECNNLYNIYYRLLQKSKLITSEVFINDAESVELLELINKSLVEIQDALVNLIVQAVKDFHAFTYFCEMISNILETRTLKAEHLSLLYDIFNKYDTIKIEGDDSNDGLLSK
jgi:hypothetical protein